MCVDACVTVRGYLVMHMWVDMVGGCTSMYVYLYVEARGEFQVSVLKSCPL